MVTSDLDMRSMKPKQEFRRTKSVTLSGRQQGRIVRIVSLKNEVRFDYVLTYREFESSQILAKHKYGLASCPWLDGFRDHQTDVFVIVKNE
jgi:hypothetical protein